MKKLEVRIRQAAKDGRVTQIVVERDYVQGYVLFGISRTEAIRETLVFKGGTALKKMHFGDYRFSEGLPLERNGRDVRAAADSGSPPATRRGKTSLSGPRLHSRR